MFKLRLILAIIGIASGMSYILLVLADKDPEDYSDIENLSKEIDDGEMDDHSVDWSLTTLDPNLQSLMKICKK
jgi:hypothetical protein